MTKINLIIKSITVVSMIVLLGYTDAAAQKCKYNFDKEDPISGERVRRNVYKLKKQAFTVSYYRKKDELKLELNILFAGARTFTVTTSDQLILKLTNGETLTVYPAKEYSPISQATGAGVYTLYAISYDATSDQYKQIAKNGVTHVRSNMGGETYDVAVKGKMIEKMKLGAGCILED